MVAAAKILTGNTGNRLKNVIREISVVAKI